MYVCTIYAYECDVSKLYLVISMRETNSSCIGYAVPSKNESLSHSPHAQKKPRERSDLERQITIPFHSYKQVHTAFNEIKPQQTQKSQKGFLFFLKPVIRVLIYHREMLPGQAPSEGLRLFFFFFWEKGGF